MRARSQWTAARWYARGRVLGGVLALLVGLVSHAMGAVLTETWVATPGGTADGLALGDRDGDDQYEIAVLTRGGTYAPGAVTPGIGSLALLDANGNLLWQRQGNGEMVGMPVAADFDGDGFAEFAGCEVTAAGVCWVYDGDGALLFKTAPFWYPAMSYGGPAAADVNGDKYDDLVVASMGGEIAVYLGPMGTEAWRLHLWNLNGELVFGFPAIADIDDDGALEIVVGGGGNCDPLSCPGAWGTNTSLYAIDAASGTIEWQTNQLALNGDFFEANGPALADLDGDGQLEIVAALSGTAVSAVAAYDTDGTQLWRTLLPGEDLGYTSPIVGDVDGDKVPEIFVQTLGGTLFRFTSSGAVAATYNLGAPSWSTPSLLDVDADGLVEVMALSVSQLQVLDGDTLTPIDVYDNPTAGLYPPPVQADLDVDQRVELVTGAWWPRQLYRFDLSYLPTYDWVMFGAVPGRTGWLDNAARFGDTVSKALAILFADVTALYNDPGTPGGAKNRLRRALNRIQQAWQEYMRGNPHNANDALRRAVNELRRANGVDTTYLQNETVQVALLIFRQYIDRCTSVMGPTNPDIQAAETAYATAVAQWEAGDYRGASRTVDDGTTALRNAIDSFNFSQMQDYCPPAPAEAYHTWQCAALDVWVQVGDLVNQFPGDADLANAHLYLRRGIAWTPDVVLLNAFYWFIQAENSLAAVASTDTTQLQADLAYLASRYTRAYINERIYWSGPSDPAVVQAESFFTQGETERNAGNYATAIQRYRDAVNAAQP